MTGILDGKTVVIFAATGAIGSSVAAAAEAQGATVFASGQRESSVSEHASPQSTISWDVVDATNRTQVQSHLDQVIDQTGGIDAIFNGIGGRPHLLGYPEPVEALTLAKFMIPLERIVGSTFITSGEAALRMAPAGKGSIVTLSATLSSMTAARMSNISAACAAVEGLTRSLAGEFGPDGVRVNCVRGSAMPETRTIQETAAEQAAQAGEPLSFAVPPLGRPVTVAETASTAVFLMSDLASGTTGQTLTVCAGQFV